MSEQKEDKPNDKPDKTKSPSLIASLSTAQGFIVALTSLVVAITALIAALDKAGITQILFASATATPSPTVTVARPTATVPAIVAAPTSTPVAQPSLSGVTLAVVPSPTALVIVVTATPPPAPVPPVARSSEPRNPALVVDNFENYPRTVLQENFIINRNAGNDLALSFAGPSHVLEGSQSLAFQFDLKNVTPPLNYVGFDRTLPPQDWSPFHQLCVWVESDGSGRNLVIQFGRTNNDFRKANFVLSTRGGSDFCMPLTTQPPLDLRLIGYYGIYVEGPPPGPGLLFIDLVRVVP